MAHLCVCSPCVLLLKENTIKVGDEDEEEECSSYPEGVAHEQPGDMLLEQTDDLTDPQVLGCQEAQTPEVLNGGSHESDHSLTQKGVQFDIELCVSEDTYSECNC